MEPDCSAGPASGVTLWAFFYFVLFSQVRLTQLKLAGFKSFVDPTVIPVPSQMVGVVGPNGCGKSNIIDAVRWVLGETRASELRGESMQDVIFNGSGNRKPAARASVELVFDNSDGRAVGQWSTYGEIAVRRVLTRDGTSSYYVNNQQVRRKDIHDIFLGTGLGARGYAIIGQGMINRLIEAKPEELRVYLEEAAGVSRYKERRRETENRLSDTRENLTRVEDIMRELESQLTRLEAQAEVARKYRDLQNDGEKKQHVLWLIREENARADQEKKAQEIEKAQTELEASLAELRASESEVEKRRQAHYQASDAVHAAQAAMYEANTTVSRLETEIRHVVDARNRLQARKATLNTQMQEWQDQLTHCTEQIAELEEELAAAGERAAMVQDELESRQADMPDVEEKVRSASASREAMRSELARVEQKLALTAQTQRDADRQLQQLEQRRERLQRELGEIQRPDAGRLEQLTGDRNAAEAQLEEVQATLQDMEERLPQLDEARRNAQNNSHKETQDVARLEARLSALSALQEDVQKKGALEPWLQKHDLAGFGRLWQQIHIEPGWEAALESVLRERLTALPLRDLDMARAFTDDPPPSRLAFYQKPTAEALPAALPGHTPLLSLIRCNDPDLKSLLGRWLQGVYTASSLTEALGQRQSLPIGVQLVVREGHMTDAHGLCFYAADSEQSGMLARQQEIDNLKREIKARQLIADQAVTQLARSEAAWTALSQSMTPARQRLSELTRRVHDLQMEHSRLHAQMQQSEERNARINEDLADIRVQQEELLAQKEESEAGFEALDNELATLQEAYAEAEMAGETLAETAEAARQQLRELERNVQEAGFTQRGLTSRIADLTRNRDLAGNQINQAGNELENLEAELFDFDESATQAGLQDALETRVIREEALAAARLELDNLAATLRGADETRMRTEQSLEPRRAHIMQLQLDEQAARLAVEQFSEQLDEHEVDRQALKLEMNDLPDDWSKVTWLHAEVQKISRQIEALGSVNLAALDELNESRERKGFLDAQHADLSEAIETLEDAIRRIDRETRDLLQETFNQVNTHFGDLFPKLFGGGEARLSMTGEEILDAGVQVMAQPPGKRNSTIHLLSGGEKALTATALVFALFKLNPAPFCLLDEVDAPLDDANTERYANLVNSMSDQTQFLFISHNKIAMQMAKQLIGVTMQEQGVSRIVAVDIESAVQLVGEA
ncbi:chromosome partition protein SMC [Advenella mimigardefordensis DPN7]|uniref:Chromosome partition protein Smc n=1 Tax=Advenella mimigardefordensis (strain DSM 17166 / LMG 22922 / DPN7) TaxID=1247726 RepID=W0PCA6_ADVMD|nr:chromosome partition protein SMC [Advenella mimigardefordensis DPN7]